MSDINEDLLLFNELAATLLEEEEANPVAERIEANVLFDKLDLSLDKHGIADEAFKRTMKSVLKATPKTATPLFFNQLFGGRQGKAVIGDLLAVLLNNSMYTYKVAGPMAGIEQEMIKRSCELIGYGKEANGTFPTGGSMSNYMAVVMARDLADPNCREHGVSQKMIFYCSQESHYSNAKNATFAGIGRSNVRYIDTDGTGRMLVRDLEQKIKEDKEAGCLPFMVVATAGTTVLGAMDPIDALADVTEREGLWLHVDGAFMGAVLFSSKYKHVLKGAHRANSFCYNAHKLLGVPLSSSILLVKDSKNLYDSFNNDASYLYQKTDEARYDLGKTSFQCGRRNDAFKFWTLWKSVGDEGLAKIVDHLFDLANYARDYVNNNPDYTMVGLNDSVSVCFNYKGIAADELCTMLYEKQETLVGYGHYRDLQFVRLVLVNANNTIDDLKQFFQVMEAAVEIHESVLQD